MGGLGPTRIGAECPSIVEGDGGLVERLLSSESKLRAGSAGGFGGGDATEDGGSGGGMSVEGHNEAGVETGVTRRRLTRRSGAVTGEGGWEGLATEAGLVAVVGAVNGVGE
eukprot:s3879_g4.t1